jgi:PAS domain S-box-containing protein
MLLTTLYVLAGVCLYAAIHHLWIAHHLSDRTHLLFALLCLTVTSYVLVKAGTYRAETAVELVMMRRWEVSLGIVIIGLLPWFVMAYAGLHRRLLPALLSMLLAVFLIANLLLPYGLTFVGLPTLDHIMLPWGEQVVDLRVHQRSLVFNAGWVAILLNFAFAVFVCLRQYRHGEQRKALALALALGVFLAFVLFNQVVNYGWVNFTHTAEFGFIALVLLMSAALSSELRHSSEARAASEARFRLLVEQAADGIFLHDVQGRIVDVNEQACRALGYTRAELLHMTVAEFEAEVNPARAQAVWNAMRPGAPVTVEGRHRRKDGSVFPVEVRVGLFRDNERDLVLAIVRDISTRKQAEAELQRHRNHLEELVEARTNELEAINQELEAFSYSVSHDLRAPLRSINGFSQALVEDYAGTLDTTAMDYLVRVRQGALRMGELIDDLLKLSRVTRQDMRDDKVDLSALAAESAAELRALEPQREVEFTLAAQVQVMGDPHLLRIVMDNLLGNALKYTSRMPHTHIEFGVRQDNGNAVYYVRDNGAGFDMRYADRLFGAFQRLHKAEDFPGNGIGLATVKRIVTRHGGRIWAESQPGQGATFYFTLARSEDSGPRVDGAV